MAVAVRSAVLSPLCFLTDASQSGGPQLFGVSKTGYFLSLLKQNNISNRVFGIECLKSTENAIVFVAKACLFYQVYKISVSFFLPLEAFLISDAAWIHTPPRSRVVAHTCTNNRRQQKENLKKKSKRASFVAWVFVIVGSQGFTATGRQAIWFKQQSALNVQA